MKSILLLIILASCSSKVLQYDSKPVNIKQTVTLKNDRYYQEVNSPTRNVKVKVDIKNTGDTARKFIVSIKEVQ